MILIYKKYLAVTEMPKMLIKLGLLVKGSRSALTNIYLQAGRTLNQGNGLPLELVKLAIIISF